jgi:mRNA-degrading endonuclease HigB of HigAB toxin-antitoxin module
MGRPSVIPQIKEALQTYLDEIERQWLDQPESMRQPTLPLTTDAERKVNIRAIAKAIGLRETQEKYLYEREELTALINMVADAQQVLGIGARLEPAADTALRERIAQTAKQARADAQAAVEAKAAEQELLAKLREAYAEIARLKLENASLQEQLDFVRQGIFVGM